MDNGQIASHTMDASLAAAGSKATYAGSGMTLGGWLVSSEFAVLVGIVIGVAGFLVNWYYRHKAHLRERAEHLVRMRQLEKP